MSLLSLATGRFVAAKHKRFRVQWLKTRNQITKDAINTKVSLQKWLPKREL
jgi:hypothetical protein